MLEIGVRWFPCKRENKIVLRLVSQESGRRAMELLQSCVETQEIHRFVLVHSERVNASLGEDLAITYQIEVIQHIVHIILSNEMPLK